MNKEYIVWVSIAILFMLLILTQPSCTGQNINHNNGAKITGGLNINNQDSQSNQVGDSLKAVEAVKKDSIRELKVK